MLRVGIRDVDVRRQHPEDNLAIPRRLHVGVTRGAHHIGDVVQDRGHSREGLLAVVGKVPIHMPRRSKVKGPLDVHGRRSEGGEGDNQMGEVELCLQIQLDGGILLAILRLPPRGQIRARLGLVDNLSDAMILVRIMLGLLPRVAQEALLVLQMGQDAETLGRVEATGRACTQSVLAANQEITRGRIARGALARMCLDVLPGRIPGPVPPAMLLRGSLRLHWLCPLAGEQAEHKDHGDKPQLQHLALGLPLALGLSPTLVASLGLLGSCSTLE